jgi:plastocyanin
VLTIDVSTPSGAAVADTVLVFDPLDAAPLPGHDTVVIDQVHKQFVPRVTVLRTGTAVTFPNSDQIRHQVYSFSPAKVFSLKLYAGSPKTAVTFDTPGLVVLGCNIHDQMVAFVGVVDTPYFAKTPASGSATVDLPAGRYRLRVWHPDLAAAVPLREIAVAAAPLNLPLVVQLAAAPAALADWP